MAKQANKKANKKAGKPAPKGKPVVKKAAKTAKKVAKKPSKPAPSVKKTAKPSQKVFSKKPGKPVKKAAPAKKVETKPVKPAAKPVAKPVKAAVPAKKAVPAPPAKTVKAPLPAAKTAPAAPAAAPKEVKKASTPKVVVPPLPPIDTSKLPKLPKGIVVKRGKGKLAPGEKRLVKTDVITHHVLEDKPLEAGKQKPEPKGKFTLEYVIRTPVSLLYDFLSTPNGLAEWFADGVDMKDGIYSFEWDGSKQYAKVVSAKLDSYLRLRWMDKPDAYYFEFRLEQDELTNEVSLIVTDFGDNEEDIAAMRRLWETQISRLVKALGTY